MASNCKKINDVFKSDAMNKNELLHLLQQTRFDPAGEPPLEQVVFRIQFKTIGSLGDFIMFSGRPKAGKSKYVAGGIAAAISSQEVFSMSIKLPKNKEKVAHFDTEQGKYSHYKMMQLVTKLASIESLPPNFNSYRCRSVAPAQIMALIEYYLKVNPDCGLVFLDGLLDMVDSMNDEKHSSYIKRWLKRITEEYNVLLAGVIHRGFSSDKSIGQIGSEGERAAQTVLLIEKNKETRQYTMRPEYMRDDDEFDTIAIQYNKQLSIWEQAEVIDLANEGKPAKMSKRRPGEYDISEHSNNSWRIFNSGSLLTYKNLIQRIKEVYAVGERWAVECVPILERNNIIFRIDDGFTNVRQQPLLKVE